MSVKPIPEGYHSVTPYLMVKGAAEMIEFTKKVFGAKEIHLSLHENGTVRHAEILIGDSYLMLSEAKDDQPPSGIMLYVYVNDVDETYKKAVSAGGKSIREPQNEFYGDRSAGVSDNSGIQWWMAKHVEDVPPEEMKRREEEWAKKNKK
jgi:PhnB protein